MIFDSEIWKIVLWRDLRDLRRYLGRTGLSKRSDACDRAAVAVEKFVFTSAFIVRKLFESKKVSDEVSGSKVSGTSFPRAAQTRITRLNWHHIDRHYDLSRGRSCQILVRDICNRLIHSAVFMSDFAEDQPTMVGFYFTSDRTKEDALYYIFLDDYFSIVENVIEDDILYSATNFETGKTVLSNRPEIAELASEMLESLRQKATSVRTMPKLPTI